MSYSVPASSVIDYPAETMASFPIYAFEWIDNLHFIQPPDRFLPDPSAHVEAARAAFLRAGWEGTGEVGLLWLPTFVFPMRSWPSSPIFAGGATCLIDTQLPGIARINIHVFVRIDDVP
jgi:hypothetical protein